MIGDSAMLVRNLKHAFDKHYVLLVTNLTLRLENGAIQLAFVGDKPYTETCSL